LMALYALTTHKVPSKRSDFLFSFYYARPTFLFKEPLAAHTIIFHFPFSIFNFQLEKAACGDINNSAL
ncbi:MAG: hypothetical protein ACI4FO_09205, partial [Acutalibacteraceae bacterium]